jgi:hypothetical protein
MARISDYAGLTPVGRDMDGDVEEGAFKKRASTLYTDSLRSGGNVRLVGPIGRDELDASRRTLRPVSRGEGRPDRNAGYLSPGDYAGPTVYIEADDYSWELPDDEPPAEVESAELTGRAVKRVR